MLYLLLLLLPQMFFYKVYEQNNKESVVLKVVKQKTKNKDGNVKNKNGCLNKRLVVLTKKAGKFFVAVVKFIKIQL